MAPPDRENRENREDPSHAAEAAPPAGSAETALPAALRASPQTMRRVRDRRKRPATALPLTVAIAVGAAIGVVLVFWIAAASLRWSQRASAERAAEAAAVSIEQVERDNRLQAEALEQATARRQQQAQAQERERVERIRASQDQAEAARRAQTGEAERRERAWAATYQKPPGCADVATLECSNHYIRARRAFEERFAKGLP